MGFFAVLCLFFAFQTANAVDEISGNTNSVLPIGTLPKNSQVTLERADASKSYFSPSNDSIGSYEKVDSSTLYNVKSLKSSEPNTPDSADLQALASRNLLMVQKADLTPGAANCQTSNNLTNCTLNSDLPVYQSGFFDIVGRFFSMLNPANWFASRRTADRTTDKEVAEVMNKTIEKANSKTSANGKSITKECEESENKTPTIALDGDKTLQCGIEQALAAYKNNKSQIKQDVIIFNDFSSGATMGKMWFIKPDGSPANVLDRNPIQVSRGVGGFGAGNGSLKTPNGAILTKEYNPPRGGNIRDGIELVGLESGNKDIHSRGILLHGWDPYNPTSGCLGVSGNIQTRKRGSRTLGLPPPYLDQLKKGILKDGGVLVYNFTPNKKDLCKN